MKLNINNNTCSLLKKLYEGGEQVDAFTKIFIPFIGSNGATTTLNIADSTTLTLSGGATLSTTNPKYGQAAGDFTGGASSRADLPASSAYVIGSNPFTSSCWVLFNDAASRQFIWARTDSAGNLLLWLELESSTIKVGHTTHGVQTYPFIPETGRWYHIEVGHTGTLLYVFIDGVKVIDGVSFGSSIGDTSTYVFTLGMQPLAAQNLNGKIDNWKFDIGVIRHTADFAPSGSPDYAHTALLDFDFSSAMPSSLTFSRGSHATMINSDGNLVWAPSNMLTNTVMAGAVVGTIGSGGVIPTGWYFGTGTGITREILEFGSDYIIVRISGTNTSGGIAYTHLRFNQSLATILQGQSYTLSAYLQLIAGSTSGFSTPGQLSMQWLISGTYLGQSPFAGIMTSTDTRYTSTGTPTATANQSNPGLNFGIPDGNTVDITFKVSRMQMEPTSADSPKDYNASSGGAYYGPRIDYNPSTLSSNGLLIEAQRTNVVTTSSPTSGITTSGASVAASAATMLSQSCARMTFAGTSDVHYAGSASFLFTATTRYVFSVYVKQISGNDLIQLTTTGNSFATDCYVNYNLSTVSVVGTGAGASNAAIQDCGNSVFRLSFSATSKAVPASGSAIIIVGITSASDVRIPVNTLSSVIDFFGFQCEQANVPTSLIPTVGAAATRSGDTVTYTLGSLTLGNAAMFDVDAGPIGVGTGGGSSISIVEVNDTSGNNRLCMRAEATSGQRISTVVVGGVTGMNTAFGATGFSTTRKLAQSWNATNIKFSMDNSIIQSSAAHGGLPSVTQVVIGGQSLYGSGTINGHIQRARIFKLPVILTDTALNTYTT